MPWCAICRRDYGGQEGTACPRCGRGEQHSEQEPRPAAKSPDASERPETASKPPALKPAHLAVLDGRPSSGSQDLAPDNLSDRAIDRPARRRLISSAGPSVPVRKQANDSVPSTWMARLEAARLVSGQLADKAAPPPLGPPPLKPAGAKSSSPTASSTPDVSGPPLKPDAPVGQPAHLLVAQLEAEEARRKAEESERVAALLAGDKSDEIAQVEIEVKAPTAAKKRVPDWVVFSAIGMILLAIVGFAVSKAKKEPPPVAQVDPAVQAAATRARQAVAAFDEGNRLQLENKPDAAIKAYASAIELDPQFARAERGLAVAYASKGDDEQAVEHYRNFLRLAPDATDAEDVRKILDQYERTQEKKKAAEAAARDAAARPAAPTSAHGATHARKSPHRRGR